MRTGSCFKCIHTIYTLALNLCNWRLLQSFLNCARSSWLMFWNLHRSQFDHTFIGFYKFVCKNLILIKVKLLQRSIQTWHLDFANFGFLVWYYKGIKSLERTTRTGVELLIVRRMGLFCQIIGDEKCTFVYLQEVCIHLHV